MDTKKTIVSTAGWGGIKKFNKKIKFND